MNWSAFLLEHQPFAHGAPVCLASLRASPEDFRVDELASFEPSGEGEHVFLHIRKRNQNTAWVAGRLAEAAGVPLDAVSYAGLKDRRAVTTQWFSVHVPNRQLPDFSPVWCDDIELLTQTWNARKLKRGAHLGNRFHLVLRDVDGAPEAIDARLQTLADGGVPNYIGPQRFGHGNANLAAGESLLAGKPRRRLNHREGLMISAVRSAFFNRVLGERVAAGQWAVMLPGDVLMLDGRGSFFRPEADDEALPSRIQAQELHPTGPLFGRGVPAVTEDVLALEQTVSALTEGLAERLGAFGLEAQRRALRLRVGDLHWEHGADGSLHLSFALPSGAFATSVLRELAQLRESGLHEVPVE
ncbi:MAG: tRNA pseudouridine(13) synthase TruD [Moraxellaceae bacterium]|nr:tRNA pseudouridine(13) synthase TruD [Moraxellaceae bacterium]